MAKRPILIVGVMEEKHVGGQLHGLPVVVSEAVGCAPDLVARHECGENFQTGRVEALAVGLKSSIQRGFGPEWRAGCRKVVEPYSTKKAAEGICRTLK